MHPFAVHEMWDEELVDDELHHRLPVVAPGAEFAQYTGLIGNCEVYFYECELIPVSVGGSERL